MCFNQDYFPVMLPKLLRFTSKRRTYDLLYYAAISTNLDDRDYQDSFLLVWEQCDLSTKKDVIEKIINYYPSTRSELFTSSLSQDNFVRLLQLATPVQQQKLIQLRREPGVNFFRLYQLGELNLSVDLFRAFH